MICKKCSKEIPDGSVYCNWCGTKQEKKPKSRRANSEGTVYPRGSTWTARVILGYYYVDDPKNPGKKKLRTREKTKGGFRKKADARAYCAVLKQQAEAPVAGRKITLKDLFDEWEPVYSHRVSEGAMKSHKAALQWLKDLWTVNISDITSAQLQDAIDSCPRKRRTKEDIKSLMSCLYKYAIQNDYAEKNRSEFLFCGEDDGGTRPPFSPDEIARIASCGLPYADYVMCMIYTGFRPGELLSLRKDDYDAEHRIFFHGSKTAAGKDRHIPVSRKIQPIIDARLAAPGDYFFPDPDTGTPMTDAQFRSKFKILMSDLGITGKLPYSCRHTFSVFLKNSSGSDKDKAALMGHSDYTTTKRRYQSAEDENLRAIIDQM